MKKKKIPSLKQKKTKEPSDLSKKVKSNGIYRISAFAPATVGNVGIGFDILGMAIEGAGDIVELTLRSDSKILIQRIEGKVPLLPTSASKNTAGAALLAFQKGEQFKNGFDVIIKKGIPLGSGMGGSAASAVAAVVAASRFLSRKVSYSKLLFYALEGEKMASGASHPDNVAPCLMGGLILSSPQFENPLIELPFPKNMGWVLVHPDIQIETKMARKILSPTVKLEQFIRQTANLTSFILGLSKNNAQFIRQGLNDVVIEPQRKKLIPGFDRIQSKISQIEGFQGFSISGSGPSVFAFAKSEKKAQALGKIISSEFSKLGISSQIYSGKGPSRGAYLLGVS